VRFREVTIEEAVDLGNELGRRLTEESLEDA
jgi:hypothetical protein